MDRVNATKFTGVAVKCRDDLQEKAEVVEIMGNKNNVAILFAGTAIITFSLALAGHPLAEIVKSSNHLKEIKILEEAKNARCEMRLSFLRQTVSDVLNTIPFLPRA